MSLITLKPLDDGQKAVEIPKGKTVIGRGPFLGCSDKKVSRNHAVLEVTNKDEVFLTPTHVNPCFYQPTADSPGQILKKDVPCKLENGDSFSLLPRAYRYQLNIENGPPSEQNENSEQSGKTNGSTVDHFPDAATPNEEFGDTIVSEKAFFKEEDMEKNCLKVENTFSKRIAEIKGNDQHISTKNNDESSSVEPAQKGNALSTAEEPQALPVESSKEENTTDDKATDSQQNNLSGVEEKVSDDRESVPDEEDKAEIQPEEASLEVAEPIDKPTTEVAESALPAETKDFSPVASKTTTKTKKQKESFSKRRDKQPAKRKTVFESSSVTKGRKKMPKTNFGDGEEGTSRQPGRASSRTNRQTRQGLSLEDFVVSDDDEWQSDRSEPKRRRRKRGKQRGGDDSGSDWEVDHKKPKKASSLHKVWSGSESGSEKNGQKKKKGPRGRRKKTKSSEEVNETQSEEDEPQPSSSGEVKLSKTRIPCSFGKKCYRRNANHKEEFSHPGDSDYTSETENKKSVDTISESDGEGPKKECPYGANCFRKNPQHKKDFKHTKNVRPQREAAKQADQKSKSSRNSDDYDINDSFLNDDSDEYKPVDSGSDYESGEKTKKLMKVKGVSRKGGKKL